ncbi:hypothetical protein BC829DRAFT_398213 [Chytridium lagenaria]|nr:hypothetical protein BC829DRAFT_398213 [Chytridium lagenaria]
MASSPIIPIIIIILVLPLIISSSVHAKQSPFMTAGAECMFSCCCGGWLVGCWLWWSCRVDAVVRQLSSRRER